MLNTQIARKFATVALTVVMSATCLIGALAPAQSNQASIPVATTPIA